MNPSDRWHRPKPQFNKDKPRTRPTSEPEVPGSTGSETAFLRRLVDSRTRVSVVLKNGEVLTGQIRYYDRECFSIGLAGSEVNILLRKKSVLCIRAED